MLRRADLLLVVGFVSACVYQRAARPREFATMTIRAGVDASLGLPPRPSALVSAQPITATSRSIGKLKSRTAGSTAATTGGATEVAFIPTSTAASVSTDPEIGTIPACQGDSPCATSLDTATTPGVPSSPSVRVSAKRGAEEAPVESSRDEGVNTNRLYMEMLGGEVLGAKVLGGELHGGGPQVAGTRPATFDSHTSYTATEPVSPPDINFTPIYPWNSEFAISFVGDPSPFYVVPTNIRFLDFVTTRDSDTKRFYFDRDADRVITNGGSTQLAATTTPEPATLTLLGTGFAAVGAVRRRRRKSATD